MSQAAKLFTDGSGLSNSKAGVPIPRKVILMVAGIMLEASGRDGDYAPEELDIIRQALCRHFNLPQQGIDSLLQEANDARGGNADVIGRSIRDNFSRDQLILLLAIIWQILLGDGTLGAVERQFVATFRSRLALSEEEGREAERIARNASKCKTSRILG